MRARRLKEVKPEGDASEKLVWKIRSFEQAIMYRLVMLGDGCADGWNRGNTLSSILCSRAIVETVALLTDFEKQLEARINHYDLPGINALTTKSLFAMRLSDWHENDPAVQAVSVLTIIDKWDRALDGVRHHYDSNSLLLA